MHSNDSVWVSAMSDSALTSDSTSGPRKRGEEKARAGCAKSDSPRRRSRLAGAFVGALYSCVKGLLAEVGFEKRVGFDVLARIDGQED